jgi:hypothetical protein
MMDIILYYYVEYGRGIYAYMINTQFHICTHTHTHNYILWEKDGVGWVREKKGDRECVSASVHMWVGVGSGQRGEYEKECGRKKDR